MASKEEQEDEQMAPKPESEQVPSASKTESEAGPAAMLVEATADAALLQQLDTELKVPSSAGKFPGSFASGL